MSRTQQALELAKAGFSVFPLIENDKRPRIQNWQNLATTDPRQIAAWWKDAPDSNIGIVTSNLLVVDIDPRNGGTETVSALRMMYDFPDTVASVTANRGAHLIFALPPHTTVSGGTNLLGRGVDVKSYGGYIVAPGSALHEKKYQWVPGHAPDNRKLTPAPQWLLDLCKAPRERSTLAAQRVVEENDSAREQAIRYLEKHAPDAFEGERDNVAFKLAARLYDYGITIETNRELMLDWNEGWCHPPLELDAIERIVHSAIRNRYNPVGMRNAEAPGFEPVDISDRKAPTKPKSRFYAIRADEGARQALANLSTDPLIKGVIDRGMMSVLIGAPGGGKTFFVLDWCAHIALGTPWNGRKVHKGAVVYLALEAGKLILRRLVALEKKHGPLTDAPLFVVPCPADLAHGDTDTNEILALIKETAKGCGHSIELVVIDTLARAISGGDENSAKDMGAVIKAADRIREETGAHTMIVHHPGKDETKGGRGSSAPLGATDTEMQIAGHVLKFTKQRDMPTGDPVGFKLVPVQIGVDEDGAALTSCYVRITKPGDPVEQAPLSGREADLLEDIQEALQEDNQLTFGWQFVQKNCRKKVSDKLPTRTTILGWLSELSEKGWIKKRSPNQYVIKMSEMSESVGNQIG